MRTSLLAFALAAPVAAGGTLLAACGSGGGSGAGPGADGSATDVTTSDTGLEGGPGDGGPGPDAAPLVCPDRNPDKNVYWGDLHTHTALSGDAYDFGTRNLPHDAYRFASDPATKLQIAAAGTTPGPTVSIDRALDWDALTDHSEWLGATWGCGEAPDGGAFNPSSPYLGSMQCADYRSQQGKGISGIIGAAQAVIHLECDGGLEANPACVAFTRSAWQVEIQAAHDAYQPCTFTPSA